MSSNKLNQLLGGFSRKINNFEDLFNRFREYTTLIFNQLTSQQKVSIIKNIISEWFVCYITIYDEFFSLYVGNIWLPRHMNEQTIYEHVRKGRDHADAYKGLWTSKCSMDGIVYEVTRLNIEDERIENRVTQFSSIMDSYPQKFQRLIQEFNTKLRSICKKESIKLCFDHQVEKIEFRLEKGNTLLTYHTQRKPVINSIEIENIDSYFFLTNQRLNPTKFKRKRIIEDDGETEDFESQNNYDSNKHSRLEKIIIDIAGKCSKCSYIETINNQRNSSGVESTNISLDAIKRQYGVDPTLMRAQHEAHENETKFHDPKKAFVNILDNNSNNNIIINNNGNRSSNNHNNQNDQNLLPRTINTTTNNNINNTNQRNNVNTESLKSNIITSLITNHNDHNNSSNSNNKLSEEIHLQKLSKTEGSEENENLTSKLSITWKEKNKHCFEKWLQQLDNFSPSTVSNISTLHKFSLNVSIIYQVFSLEDMNPFILNRSYEIKLNWQTKFSENFSTHLPQLNKKISYFVPITNLFEEVYLKLWSDNIPVFPHQLIIFNSINQTEISYTAGRHCEIENLINPQNIVQLKCYDSFQINLFLKEVFESRKQKQLYPPFPLLLEIITYLSNVFNNTTKLEVDLELETSIQPSNEFILSLQSSLSCPSHILVEWFEIIYPILLKYIPPTISIQLSLSNILITKSFFVKLICTTTKLEMISCYSHLNDSINSSSNLIDLFHGDLITSFNEYSNKNPGLAELHLISCSNLFLFHHKYSYLYKLIKFLLNKFDDFKILNLKNSIKCFSSSLNIFSRIRNENIRNNTESVNNTENMNASFNEEMNKNKMKEFFDEFYTICSEFNEKNVTKCLELNGIKSNNLIEINKTDYLEKFESLNNLTVIFNLDEN